MPMSPEHRYGVGLREIGGPGEYDRLLFAAPMIFTEESAVQIAQHIIDNSGDHDDQPQVVIVSTVPARD